MKIITFESGDKYKLKEGIKPYEELGYKIVQGSKESEIGTVILMLAESDMEAEVLKDMEKQNIRNIFISHLWGCIFDFREDIAGDDVKSSTIANFMENIADLVFNDKGE